MVRALDRSYETFDLSLDKGVVTLTFQRPDQLNAMSLPMRKELGDFFLECATETDIRCLILTGAGRAFSAGGDINDFQASAEDMHDLMGRISHRWFKALWALPQPVVAAVNGVAAGGGCNMVLASDIVVASTKASFAQTFLKIGLVPDLGGAFSLPRQVGLHRAKELALLGDRIPADEAHRIGLVNRLVEPEDLMDEARGIAARLAAAPRKAVTLTKRILNRAFESSMEQLLDDEWMAQSFLFGTADSEQGVQSFLNKGGKKKRPA